MICDKCIHKELCKTAEFEHFYGADKCEFYDEIAHGHWIELPNDWAGMDGYLRFECSECYREVFNCNFSYCPYCGADMRGETE